MKEGIILRDKCPICNSTSSKTIFNRSFNEELIKEYMNEAYQGNADIEFLEDVLFEIVKCNECNFSYQKHVLDEVRLNELYNKWIDPKLAQEWHDSGKGNKSIYTFILNFAKDHLNKESAKINILDYGAGFGDSLLLAKESGFDNSYAYEYSTERIRFLEEKGIKVIDDKTEMLFDVILVNQVLEHLTNPDEILNAIVPKLSKNGIMYISVPNCPQIEKKLERTSKIKDAKELHKVLLDASVGAFQHVNFFSRSNLKLLFKKHGIKPIGPFKLSLTKPFSTKSFLRQYYRYYFRTSFLLIKQGNYN